MGLLPAIVEGQPRLGLPQAAALSAGSREVGSHCYLGLAKLLQRISTLRKRKEEPLLCFNPQQPQMGEQNKVSALPPSPMLTNPYSAWSPAK